MLFTALTHWVTRAGWKFTVHDAQCQTQFGNARNDKQNTKFIEFQTVFSICTSDARQNQRPKTVKNKTTIVGKKPKQSGRQIVRESERKDFSSKFKSAKTFNNEFKNSSEQSNNALHTRGSRSQWGGEKGDTFLIELFENGRHCSKVALTDD